MRLALATVALLLLSCRSPSAYRWPMRHTPETAACVQRCGELRNGCADARRWSSLLWLGIGALANEGVCTEQFDHCVDACPGVGEAPAAHAAPGSETELRR